MTMQLFTPRYFSSGNNIVYDQVQDAIDVGVSPNLIIPTVRFSDEVITNFANYLVAQRKDKEFSIMGDVGSDLNGVSKSGREWTSKVEVALDNARLLNEALESLGSDLRIETMGIKPAPLVDYREQTATRWDKFSKDYDSMASPLSREDALVGFGHVKDAIEKIAGLAFERGLTINVETDQPSYFVSRPNDYLFAGNTEEAKKYIAKHRLDTESRRLAMPYFPWHVQGLPVATNARAMNELLMNLATYNPGSGVKMDAEHWQMTYNLGRENPIVGSEIDAMENVLAKCLGYLVDEGQRLRFVQDTVVEAIFNLKVPIVGIDFPGFVNNPIAINDYRPDGSEVIRIPETLPLVFNADAMKEVAKHYKAETGHDLNPIDFKFAFDSFEVQEQIGREVLMNATNVLDAVSRKGDVAWANLEFKLDSYSGEHWKRALRTSVASFRWLESQLQR